jgi:cytoplasmic FMR1 interacting protein
VVQEVAAFLENGKKARRLNSHVFSLLRAQSPHMDKLASMIKQNGTVLQHFKLPVTPSLLSRLALRGKSHNKKTWQYFSCASYTKNTRVPKIPKISGVMGSSFV